MTNEKMIRLFTAIELPREILQKIGQIQFRLQKLIRGSVRWLRLEGIHLTIKFLGDAPISRRTEIEERLDQQARRTPPMTLQASRLGAFPNLDRPRVIWIGIEGGIKQLEELQKRLDDAFLPLGFAAEERPFQPHLTLARVKIPKMLTGLAAASEHDTLYDAGSFCAAGLSLIQSELTPERAVYTRLAFFPFEGVGRG